MVGFMARHITNDDDVSNDTENISIQLVSIDIIILYHIVMFF